MLYECLIILQMQIQQGYARKKNVIRIRYLFSKLKKPGELHDVIRNTNSYNLLNSLLFLSTERMQFLGYLSSIL